MSELDGLSLPSVAVHAGRTDLTDLGVHAVPIDLSTTAPLPDVSEARDILDGLIEGRPLPHGASTIYRRAWNPTVARFEQAVAALEGHVPGGTPLDVEGVAFASGMAATHAVILSRVAAGLPHVIAVRPLYGGTDAILETGLLGTTVTYAEPHEIGDHVTDRTGLVVLETPSNPTLELRDIADIVRQAGDVPVMIDNTFASPVLQQPLRHGATYSVHSATKYLGGHGDAMGVSSSPPRRWPSRCARSAPSWAASWIPSPRTSCCAASAPCSSACASSSAPPGRSPDGWPTSPPSRACSTPASPERIRTA